MRVYYQQNVKHKSNKSSYSNPHLKGVNVSIDFGNGNEPFKKKIMVSRQVLLLIENLYLKQLWQQIMVIILVNYLNQDQLLLMMTHADNSGQKYYVVDTYHHCIQCFEQIDNIQSETGEKYNFKSSDEKLNNKKGFYLYNKDWEINDYKL